MNYAGKVHGRINGEHARGYTVITLGFLRAFAAFAAFAHATRNDVLTIIYLRIGGKTRG
jgi:hypothetical protein